jgi:hypothetical protein
MILMVSSHLYILCFNNLSMYHAQIYILLVLCQNPFNINFLVVFEVSGTAEAVFNGHVRPLA